MEALMTARRPRIVEAFVVYSPPKKAEDPISAYAREMAALIARQGSAAFDEEIRRHGCHRQAIAIQRRIFRKTINQFVSEE